jgi:hypothetical protein
VGLLKTAATVAVASSVHGRVQRRQQARWAVQDQAHAPGAPPPPPQYAAPPPPQQAYVEHTPVQPAPVQPVPVAAAPVAAAPVAAAPVAAAAVGSADRLAQLKQLGELMAAGVLTQAEFDQEKTRILSS